MAFQPGRNGYFSIDGTDVTAYCDDASFERTRDTLETTTFGVDDRAYISGLRMHKISLSGPWDPTADAVFIAADDAATVAFVFGPEGNDSGDVQYTGNALFESYNVSQSPDGRTEWSASFQPTGTVTRGTV